MKSNINFYRTSAKLIAVFIAIVFLACSGNEKQKVAAADELHEENTVSAKEDKLVKPPFPELNRPFKTFDVSAEDSTSLVYETGTEIRVPANAFLDKDGNTVKGAVQLNYREWHSPMDIMLSGIPMNYDSDDGPMYFESAGMCEIKVTQQGKQLYPNPKSKINIEMTSTSADPKFNRYVMDTIRNKWVLEGKSDVKIQRKEDELKTLPQVPEAPKEAGNYAFNVEDPAGMQPDLAMYKNILFEPVNKQPCGNDATKIELNKGKIPGTYDVVFIVQYNKKVISATTCNCYLVFKKGADYEASLSAYRKKYKNILERKEKRREIIEQKWAAYKQKLKLYNEEVEKNNWPLMSPEQRVQSVFSVNKFGTINCDCPQKCPKGAELYAEYTDLKGNKIEMASVNLIERSLPIVYNYYRGEKVWFNPSVQNTLWGITSNNKLAYFRGTDFKQVTVKRGNYKFKMNIEDKVTSKADLEKLLMY